MDDRINPEFAMSLNHVIMRLLGAIVLMSMGTGCLKDPVPEGLKDNPFDQDFEGTPLIELANSYTSILTFNGTPYDTIVGLNFIIHTERFPEPTLYRAVFTDVQTNAITLGPEYSSSTVAHYEFHHVLLGNQYCLDAQLRVLFTDTKKWRICAQAEL